MDAVDAVEDVHGIELFASQMPWLLKASACAVGVSCCAGRFFSLLLILTVKIITAVVSGNNTTKCMMSQATTNSVGHILPQGYAFRCRGRVSH